MAGISRTEEARNVTVARHLAEQRALHREETILADLQRAYTRMVRAKETDHLPTFLKALHAQQARVEAAAESLAALKRAGQQERQWKARRAFLHAELQAHYANLGPQYDLLIERAVAALVRVEQVEAGVLPAERGHWYHSQRESRDALMALQRYTESTKQEHVVRHAEQTAILRVLTVVERVVAGQSPQLWEAIVTEVERGERDPQAALVEATA